MGMLGTGYRPIADWICDEKYFLSKSLGYDVGVPLTVDYLISRAHTLRAKYSNSEKSGPNSPILNTMDSILLVDANNDNIALREVWINTYFFGSGFYNEANESQGYSHLEGELRRHTACISRIPVEDVILAKEDVLRYSRAHRLDDSFVKEACKKLRL